jgi:hypothetical protein
MRGTVAGATLVAAVYLSLSIVVVAKGSGGGHGGGHSGGHGGHGSASAGGHSGGGRSSGTSRGAGVTRGSSGGPSTSGTSTNQTPSGRRHDGQPIGTAVPRERVTSPSFQDSHFVPYWFSPHYGGTFGFSLGYLSFVSFPFYGYGYSSLGYGSFGGWPHGHTHSMDTHPVDMRRVHSTTSVSTAVCD